MWTVIIQVWLVGTCVGLLAMIVRDQRQQRRLAIEAGKLAAAQTAAACKARAAGEEAKRVGTIIYLNSVGLAEMDKNSARGVPPRLDYLRTPAEMRAIRERIISEASISIAECRERQRIQGRN